MPTPQSDTDLGLKYLRGIGLAVHASIFSGGIYSILGNPMCRYENRILYVKLYIGENHKEFPGTVFIRPELWSDWGARFVPLAEVEFSAARP